MNRRAAEEPDAEDVDEELLERGDARRQAYRDREQAEPESEPPC